MEKIIAIIPARGGSKGIPRKNIKLLSGKPLIAYSIEAAKHSPCVSQIIVSTEDEEIAGIAQSGGAEVVLRPLELAQDNTATEPVLEHAVEFLEDKNGYKFDWVILLQPTSPFRENDDIEKAWQKLKERNGDSLLSVSIDHSFYWTTNEDGYSLPVNYDFQKRPRRQEMEQCRENGSIYITRRDILMQRHCRLGGKIVTYVMLPENSTELDTMWDWWLAEKILDYKKGRDI